MPFILSWLIFLYLHVVGLTSRVIVSNRAVRDRLEREEGGYLYAFWHARQAVLIYLHRGDRVCAMISRSKDGEIIAQVAKRFSTGAIRGSTSRGAVGAMMGMERELLDGGRVSFTPDGPRGPLHSVSPGVLFLAQKTGKPIVPVASGSKRKIVLNNWDRFQVALPFSRLAIVYGEPLYVAPEADLEEAARTLQAALNRVGADADRIAQGGAA